MEPQGPRESNSQDRTLAKIGSAEYLSAMLRKEIVIPPAAAKAFIRDMKAFFKAKGQLEHDEIAAKQLWLLKEHLPRGTKLRTSDVKELFLQMKDQA